MSSIQDDFQSRIHGILDLDKLGLPISPEAISEVHAAGMSDLFAFRSEQREEEVTESDIYDGRKHLWLYKAPDDRGPGTEYDEPAYFDRIPEEWKKEWKNKEIKRSDWLPEGAPTGLEPDLRAFLLSCMPRFDNLKAYKKFWLYCEQARRWGPDANKIEAYQGRAQVEYAMQEFSRARQNKLYGLDGYVTIKDETAEGGRRIYKASAPQALLLYLKDCGYSYVLLKGRQAAITSTMMAAAQLTALVTPSYQGALIVDKEQTAKGIFNNKFKSTYQFMPEWWQADPRGMIWSEKKIVMDFDPGSTKAEKRKYTAEFAVYPSSDTQTINSNSPTETYFDESQKIPTLQEILKEIKPTMLAATSSGLRVLRSVYLWGTGGTGDLGKGAFEGEWRSAYSKLEDPKSDSIFMIPLFFDAFCRPYMDRWVYMKQYSDYMDSKEEFLRGMSKEENQAVFSAHYPMHWDDCFMSGTRTVVPLFIIKKQRDRTLSNIYSNEFLRPVKGMFEPVYDKEQPMPHGSFCPYKIVDATFKIAPPNYEDPMPVTMFKPFDRTRTPDRDWVNRFFQGTDPIQADAGASRMGSVILDAAAATETRNGVKIYAPTLACAVNHRSPNVKETFLQCVLMGIYYRNHGQDKCMELIEYEQGHNYIDFQKQPFLMVEDSMMLRGALEPQYAGGQHIHGISMKKERKSRAFIDLAQLIYDHGHNIYLLDFWSQLGHIESEERQDGSLDWGTKDSLKFNDDLVFGALYSYLCWKSVNEKPRKVGSAEAPLTELRMVPVRMPDMSLRYEQRVVNVDYGYSNISQHQDETVIFK